MNLDAEGSVHFGRLMRVETTIEALYHQMPPLVLQVLKAMPQPAHQHFRLLPQSSSRSSKPFDLECCRTVTLRDVMVDYLPGTFEFKFQLLCNGEPINFEQELLQMSQQNLHHAPPPPNEQDDVRKVLLSLSVDVQLYAHRASLFTFASVPRFSLLYESDAIRQLGCTDSVVTLLMCGILQSARYWPASAGCWNRAGVHLITRCSLSPDLHETNNCG